MRIFLTGGTGFLGKRLARRFVEAGHEVRALVRRPPPSGGAGRRGGLPEGVTFVVGDVTDAASLDRGADGCDAMVHSAALVKMWVRDRSQFDRVNVDGLRLALEAARRAGVSRILYTSSFIALGPTDGRVADESWLHAPGGHHNDYERTKAAADIVAREAAAAGAPLVTVYPGVVYGAGEMTDGSLMTRTIRDFMNRRVPGFLGSGDQKICYAFIDDVVEGHLLALERARPGTRYILGGCNADYHELFSLLAKLTGAPVPTRHLPFWLMGAALQQAGTDLANLGSLQRGARNFVNYCLGCHSLRYMRYSQVAADLALTEDAVQENLMFTGSRIYDAMESAMPAEQARQWFGNAPPDLSLIARSRGVDYVYTFLKSFYDDPSRPTGANNAVLPQTAMPDVLVELQGEQMPRFETHDAAGGKPVQQLIGLAPAAPGVLSAEEFDDFVRDTVAFLEYVSEPAKAQRMSLGIWVVLFLLMFAAFSYFLYKEYWKDVK